jgi:hypothetical protein
MPAPPSIMRRETALFYNGLGVSDRGKAKAAPDAIEKDAARPVARRAGRGFKGKENPPGPSVATVRRAQGRRICHMTTLRSAMWPFPGALPGAWTGPESFVRKQPHERSPKRRAEIPKDPGPVLAYSSTRTT